MKHFFRFVFALASISISLTATSQVVYPLNADSVGELSEVVECSLPKETVYKNALELATSMSGKIILRDDDNYKLIFEGLYRITPEWKVICTGFTSPDVKIRVLNDDLVYRMTIECKDGRYRVKVNNIIFTYKVRYELTKNVKSYSRPVTNENRQNFDYMSAKSLLEHIENKDTSQMGKKELTKHTAELELAREAFEYFKNLNQTEYDTLLGIIASAKKKLAVNDDF